jgi:alpha-tubulin suppressor-like RCC1 family protein
MPIPQKIALFTGEYIERISAGCDVSAAINDKGQIFTWGKTKGGICTKTGGRAYTSNLQVPTLVEGFEGETFKQIACGRGHIAAVTVDGKLFTWGNNENGKLGLGVTPPSISTKDSIREYKPVNYADMSMQGRVLGPLKDKFVVQVECGYHTTACLTKEGEVYTWGKGLDGALGLGSYDNGYEPRQVKDLPPIKAIKCGGEFMLALDLNGNVYSWGKNKNGQLGVKGGANLKECKPGRIEYDYKQFSTAGDGYFMWGRACSTNHKG